VLCPALPCLNPETQSPNPARPCAGAAHIGAMYTAFLAVAIACGTPPMLAAIALRCVQVCRARGQLGAQGGARGDHRVFELTPSSPG
jgi:hypothetical protein